MHRKSPVEDEYDNFFKSLPNQFTEESLKTLGANSPQKDAYFAESDIVIQDAKNFLKEFWANSDYLKSTKEYTLSHYDSLKDKDILPKDNKLYPQNLSLVSLEINKKHYCLVVFSSPDQIRETDIHKKIIDFINEWNIRHKQDKNAVEYIYIKGSASFMSKLFAKYNTDKPDFKTCSEKYYVDVLAKLFLRFGNAMRVLGVTNCMFYPYHGEFDREKINVTAYNSDKNEYMVITDKINVLTRSCCADCVKNKPAALHILKHAQTVGEQQKNNKPENTMHLGYLRHNFGTHSSIVDRCPDKPTQKQSSTFKYSGGKEEIKDSQKKERPYFKK